jgi:hypothetical protein
MVYLPLAGIITIVMMVFVEMVLRIILKMSQATDEASAREHELP